MTHFELVAEPPRLDDFYGDCYCVKADGVRLLDVTLDTGWRPSYAEPFEVSFSEGYGFTMTMKDLPTDPAEIVERFKDHMHFMDRGFRSKNPTHSGFFNDRELNRLQGLSHLYAITKEPLPDLLRGELVNMVAIIEGILNTQWP